MIAEILYPTLCYIFSSFPNGYFITKWATKKDIRKLGYQKLSGSNVIKNIGVLPGVFSGSIDILKGVLAVAGAQILGFSGELQAISGVLALCGQMWPVFLKFWGGRGGAVSIGAFLVFSPKILCIAIIIWLVCKILSKDKGAAIGMILFYILCAIFGSYWQIEGIVMFSIIALDLILIQRMLGKPGSLLKIRDRKIILWRLLLDRDTKRKLYV